MRAHLLVPCALLLACGAPRLPPSVPLTELNAVRKAPLVLEAKGSPAYKEGERFFALASAAEGSGDPATAEAYASTARAWFERAALKARLDRAEREEHAVVAELATAEMKAGEARSDVSHLETELAELHKRLLVAGELRRPLLEKASPERAKARAEAAVALAEEASLLCQAAELVGAKGEMYTEAVKQLDQARAHGGALSEAITARESCLRALGDARRAADAAKPETSIETLFDDLSRAGWFPLRDERGVIVTLDGNPPEEKVRSLARVAVAHPAMAVQLVGHDASPGKAAPRIDAARKALAQEGVAEASIGSHDAGARLPVLHPSDPQARAKNPRLEVVFVSKTN
jgi:hypothetical protein